VANANSLFHRKEGGAPELAPVIVTPFGTKRPLCAKIGRSLGDSF
jgi:hypothetical protein